MTDILVLRNHAGRRRGQVVENVTLDEQTLGHIKAGNAEILGDLGEVQPPVVPDVAPQAAEDYYYEGGHVEYSEEDPED